jgi:hypothetical protein
MSDKAPDPEKLRALGRRLDDVHRREAAAKVEPRPSPLGFVLRLETELVLALFVGAAAGIRNVFRMARKLNAQNAVEAAAAPKDEGDD